MHLESSKHKLKDTIKWTGIEQTKYCINLNKYILDQGWVVLRTTQHFHYSLSHRCLFLFTRWQDAGFLLQYPRWLCPRLQPWRALLGCNLGGLSLALGMINLPSIEKSNSGWLGCRWPLRLGSKGLGRFNSHWLQRSLYGFLCTPGMVTPISIGHWLPLA